MKCQRRCRSNLRLAIGWTLVACRAWGVPGNEQPVAVAQPATAERSTTEPSTDSPEQLYAAALKSYGEGDLEAALGFMQACHDATKSPNLLFNLGQLHAELKHCELGRDHYRSYLEAVPNGEMRQEAELQLASLELQCPHRRVVTAAQSQVRVSRANDFPKTRRSLPELARVESTTSSDRVWGSLGWIAAGVGAASAAAGVYFALETRSAKGDVESEHEQLRAGALTYEDSTIDQRSDDFYRNRTLMYVSSAGAIAFIVGSVCAFVVATPVKGRDSVSILATPRSTTVDWGLRF